MESTGAETHLFSTIAGVEVRCMFCERIDVRPGSTLHLTVDRRHVNVFDPATGLHL